MLTKPAAARPLLEPLRDSLRQVLGVPCFIRRSRRPDALLVTDAPRNAPDGRTAERIEATGDWIALPERGLLHLEPSPALWKAIAEAAPRCGERRPEAYPAYPFLASCALRLAMASTPPEAQPADVLRLTLKRLEAGEYARLQEELPPLVAVLQRNRAPLPEAAGRYILYELEHLKKER